MNAIVLAGGKGTRLAPWLAPKCLMPVNGVTILQRLLKHLLVKQGDVVDRAIICTGYRSEDVEAAVVASAIPARRVLFSDAGEDVAMGARLLKARQSLPGGPALICYGDELADVDLGRMLETHEGKSITFAAAKMRIPGGTVTSLAPLRIVEGQEVLTNIGFVLVEPECWTHLQVTDGLSDWINRLAINVGVHYHTGRRATINSIADLRGAEEVWR